jgi:hypothetical protein
MLKAAVVAAAEIVIPEQEGTTFMHTALQKVPQRDVVDREDRYWHHQIDQSGGDFDLGRWPWEDTSCGS